MFSSKKKNVVYFTRKQYRQQRNTGLETGISLFDTFRTPYLSYVFEGVSKSDDRNVPDVLMLFHRNSGMDNPDVLKFFIGIVYG